MSYAQYRANKIESGLLYQDFVVDSLLQTLGLAVTQYSSKFYQIQVGESRQGVEIKHDELYASTGNLWIEMAEKAQPRAGDYAPAGIHRHDNAWLYVIGNYNVIFGFAIVVLRAVARRYPVRINKTETSRGFLLPDGDARKYASFILAPNAELKVLKAIRDLQDLGRVLHAAALANPAQFSLFDDTDR